MGSWLWTIGSEAVVWSEQAHLIFGTDADGPPATYDLYLTMIHPDDRERVLSVIRAAENSVRLIGSLQDVTQTKAVARELQRSSDLFAGVLDAATEQSIIATDPQGVITVFPRSP